MLAHLSDCAEYYNTHRHTLSVICTLRMSHSLTHVKGGILLVCAAGDPESTMGVLSEMLFQMKQNVINNPLAEDVSVFQSGGKQQMSCNGTVRLGRTL